MRKGASGVDLLGVIAIGFVVATVTMAIGAKVLADVQATQTAGSVAALSISNGTTAIGNLATNVPLIATIAALVIVISFVLMLKGRSE